MQWDLSLNAKCALWLGWETSTDCLMAFYLSIFSSAWFWPPQENWHSRSSRWRPTMGNHLALKPLVCTGVLPKDPRSEIWREVCTIDPWPLSTGQENVFCILYWMYFIFPWERVMSEFMGLNISRFTCTFFFFFFFLSSFIFPVSPSQGLKFASPLQVVWLTFLRQARPTCGVAHI